MRKESGKRVKNVRERVFPYIVYRVGERKVEKGRGKDMFIIYRTLVHKGVLSANIRSIYHTFKCVPTFRTFVCTFSSTYEYTLI